MFIRLATGFLCCILSISMAHATPMKKSAERFIAAYPAANMRIEQVDKNLFIAMEGQQLLFGPTQGCPDYNPDALNNPSDPPLCTMLAQAYPKGDVGRYPEPGFDPGRIRTERLFRILYGDTEKAVAKHSRTVSCLGVDLTFSTRHGAADALERVSQRLQVVLDNDPQAGEFIFPIIGSFFWRTIQATERLSMHSFAIALDFNIEKGLYWLWKPDQKLLATIRATYPQAVVDAFEAEGFIWGGKWHSFDFMHFEYRPELLLDE